MTDLLKKLEGGDLRSIGRSNEVVAQVIADPALIDGLFEGLFHEDARVRARAADALEKISIKQPQWLKKYRVRLLRDVTLIDQKEVRWHLAQILGRLQLTARQRERAVKILRRYLTDSDSQIVRVSALQALADLAKHDQTLQPCVSVLLQQSLKSGSPSLQARARKLLRPAR